MIASFGGPGDLSVSNGRSFCSSSSGFATATKPAITTYLARVICSARLPKIGFFAGPPYMRMFALHFPIGFSNKMFLLEFPLGFCYMIFLSGVWLIEIFLYDVLYACSETVPVCLPGASLLALWENLQIKIWREGGTWVENNVMKTWKALSFCPSAEANFWWCLWKSSKTIMFSVFSPLKWLPNPLNSAPARIIFCPVSPQTPPSSN